MSGPLDVGLALPTQEGLSAREYVELARLGDEKGFHTVTVGEIAGADAFTILGAIASTTNRIRLGSGIIAIYNRSPVLTAMSFASLESLAPGRSSPGSAPGVTVSSRTGTTATSRRRCRRCASTSRSSAPSATVSESTEPEEP